MMTQEERNAIQTYLNTLSSEVSEALREITNAILYAELGEKPDIGSTNTCMPEFDWADYLKEE